MKTQKGSEIANAILDTLHLYFSLKMTEDEDNYIKGILNGKRIVDEAELKAQNMENGVKEILLLNVDEKDIGNRLVQEWWKGYVYRGKEILGE